jgi:hypothetical protein
MALLKRILSVIALVALGAMCAFAQANTSANKALPKAKTTAVKTHMAQGSVVTANDDSLTLRSGKKDMSFKINSSTQKPTTLTPGTNVMVNYHDEGNQHIASIIQMAPTKSNAAAAKPPAGK